MNPESDIDPYAPPAADPTLPPALPDESGSLWRMEGGRLLVRDGAVLPEICILSGGKGDRGKRLSLRLRLPLFSKLYHKVIQVSLFRSYRGARNDVLRFLAGPVLGFGAGLLSSVLMTGDDSATTASISVSFGLIGLGVIVIPRFQAHKVLQAVPAHDGWHELRGVHPALAHFETIQGAMPEIPHSSRDTGA